MKTVFFGKKRFNSMLGTATITLVVVSMMLMSDTIIEGHFMGESGIAGINLVLPVYLAINFFATIISMGSVYLIYNAKGEFKNQRANEFFSQSVILSVICGIIAMLLMVFCKDVFWDMMKLSFEVRREAEAYWKYEQILALIIPINFLMIELVYADGDEFLSALANIMQVFGNIILSIFLCKNLGTEGVSLGTLIGTLLATFILGIHFLRKCNTYYFIWHMSFNDSIEILKLSIVDAIAQLCMTVFSFGLNYFVIARFTDKYLPIVSMVISFFELALFFDGIGEALKAIETIYISENNGKNGRMIAKYGCMVAIIEGLCVTVIMLLFSKCIPQIYNITSPDLVNLSIKAIRIIAFMFPFVSVLYMITSQYLIVRHIRLACVGAVIGLVLLYLVLGCFMGSLFGFTAIWVGITIASLLAVLLILLYVRFAYKKSMFPWLIEPDTYAYENYSFYLNESDLIRVRNQIEVFLRENKVTDSIIYKAMMIIEDTGLVIKRKNAEKTIIVEITVSVKKKGIELIFRDTGVIFNLTDSDEQVIDISAYVVSRLYDSYKIKKYLLTVGYNRNMLFIPFNK